MGLFKWLRRKKGTKDRESAMTKGAKAFLDGKKQTLTSSDVDPDNAAKYGSYEKAMALKKSGNLSAAADLLINSCIPPSIYKGHYRELFKIWRQFNRDDNKQKKYQPVIDRVLTMIRFDDEMIVEMLQYWSIQQNRNLPGYYFEKDRNLKISDAKALLKAARALGRNDVESIAEKLIEKFGKEKKSL